VTVRTEAFDDPAQVKAKLESFASRDGRICNAGGWWWRFGSETGPSGQERCAAHPLWQSCGSATGSPRACATTAPAWVWTEIEEGGEQAWAFDETSFSTAGPGLDALPRLLDAAKEGHDGRPPLAALRGARSMDGEDVE
jgi:hypothetical protein